jgi:hypothetical protein
VAGAWCINIDTVISAGKFNVFGWYNHMSLAERTHHRLGRSNLTPRPHCGQARPHALTTRRHLLTLCRHCVRVVCAACWSNCTRSQDTTQRSRHRRQPGWRRTNSVRDVLCYPQLPSRISRSRMPTVTGTVPSWRAAPGSR